MMKTLTPDGALVLKNLCLSSTRIKTRAPTRERLILTHLSGTEQQRRENLVKFLDAIFFYNKSKTLCPFRPGHEKRTYDTVQGWVDPEVDEQVEQYCKVEEGIKEICRKLQLPYLPKETDLEEYEKTQRI